MKNKIESKIRYLIFGSIFLGSLLLSFTTYAAGPAFGRGASVRSPGVFGTVSAINGNSLTVNSKGFGKSSTATTYTVDVTSATVTKNGSASSIGNIAVGDTVMVAGTINGANVTATAVRDGIQQGQNRFRKTAPIIKGNGQPVIGGSITAINGSELTVTNKSNVTYTVDATNATIEKGNATSSVSALAIGDNVVIQGTVNGSSVTASSVTASSVTDSGANNNGNAANQASNPRKGGIGEFLGGVGSFIHNLFGFF